MFLKVKVLGKIVSILTTLANKADTQRFTAKVNARTKLNKKIAAAHKERIAKLPEYSDAQLSLEMALTEEIAALEQRYVLKQQGLEADWQVVCDKEKVAKKVELRIKLLVSL